MAMSTLLKRPVHPGVWKHSIKRTIPPTNRRLPRSRTLNNVVATDVNSAMEPTTINAIPTQSSLFQCRPNELITLSRIVSISFLLNFLGPVARGGLYETGYRSLVDRFGFPVLADSLASPRRLRLTP